MLNRAFIWEETDLFVQLDKAGTDCVAPASDLLVRLPDIGTPGLCERVVRPVAETRLLS